MRSVSKAAALLASALVLAGAGVAQPASDAAAPKAKNVIFMIGDGTGFNQLLAGSLYENGEAGQLVYEKTFTPLAMSTYSAKGAANYDPQAYWSDPDYAKKGATDSAAAATAMATATKTNNGAIGIDPALKPVRNITEAAEEAGKATGVISSVAFAHATPAGFVAHVEERGSYEAIAKQMLASKVDVIMGTGNPDFDNDGKAIPEGAEKRYEGVGGPDTWNQLKAGAVGNNADGDADVENWTLIQKREEFQKLAEGDTPERVLGVAQSMTTLQQERSGDPMAGPGAVPLTENVPTLAEMSKAALNVLDNDPDGFFLMIEGGAIDWASHDSQTGRMIEEVADFNRTIEAVVQWVEKNSNWDETLVIVTADHETGYLCGPDKDVICPPVTGNGKGQVPNVEWRSGSHTNSLVPLYVKGPGAELIQKLADQTDPKRGLYADNTEVSRTVFKVLTGSEPDVPAVATASATAK